MAKPRFKSTSDACQNFFVFISFVFSCIMHSHMLIDYLKQLLKSLYIHTDEGVSNGKTCLEIYRHGFKLSSLL